MPKGEDTANHPSRRVGPDSDQAAMAHQAALKSRLRPMDPRQISYLQDQAGRQYDYQRAAYGPDYDPIYDPKYDD